MKFLHQYKDLLTKKVFFFDLDDTLIKTISGKTFPENATDFQIQLETIRHISQMYDIEYCFIVSNQAGLGRFGTSKEEFDAKFNSIISFINHYINTYRKNKVICKGLYCAAKGSNAKNRKPNTGMLERLTKNLDIPKDQMIMIGDASGIHTDFRDDFSDSDLRTAKNFGIDYMDIADFNNLDIPKMDE